MNEEKLQNGYRSELYTPAAKQDRFKRIAVGRTNRILNDIRLLGNTSNKTLYSYTDRDVAKIFETINIKLTEVKAKFKNAKSDKFTLDD